MKFAVDRIEKNIVILENLETEEKIEVSINNLPNHTKEGTILSFINNKYIHDKEEEKKRHDRIMDKFNRLKK